MRRFRDFWVLLVWIGIPLLVGSLITTVIGGAGGAPPNAKLFLADQDQSIVSSLVVTFFGQDQISQLIELELVDEEEGKSRLADGEGSALLIIPVGFGDAVINENETELLLLTNPSQQILPAMIEETTSLLVDGAFYIQRIFGEEFQTISATFSPIEGESFAPQDSTVSELAVAINQKMGRISEIIFPPLLEVQTLESEENTNNESFNFGLLFFPGILLMALVWTAQGLSDDFWKEREIGTMRRLMSTPKTANSFITGKTLGTVILMGGVLLIVLSIGFLYHGLPLIKLPLSLLWLILGGLVFYALMTLVQLLSPTHKAGSMITSISTFPLLMVGGSFFPFETMPAWMTAIGKWTPNGLILDGLKNYFLDRLDTIAFLQGTLILFGAAAILLMLVAWRSRTFARGA